MRHLLPLASLAVLVLAGCFYSPVGVNNSPDVYPTPGTDGAVALTYEPPTSTEPTSVTFLLELGDEEASAPSVVDDSADDGFTASFDASNLNPGVYFVSIFLDEDESPTGRLAFVKPDPELATEEPAEGEGEATEGDGEATEE